MVGEDYTSFSLIWDSREILVSFQENWLNSGQTHVELRCADRLPVTETGYRSMFFPNDTFPNTEAFGDHILGLLASTSDAPACRRSPENERQFRLF